MKCTYCESNRVTKLKKKGGYRCLKCGRRIEG